MLSIRSDYCCGICLAGAIFVHSASAETAGQAFFSSMNPNEWTEVPATAMPRFEPHRGMAVDSTGGRLFLFGSETHGETTPDNAVHIFDADTLAWTRSYAPEPVENYLIDTGFWTTTINDNPWASHTFDNIVYLPDQNQLLVVVSPGHNYTGMAAVGTSHVAMQTWLYEIASNSWQFLRSSGTPQQGGGFGLWGNGLAYDPNLGKVIGSGTDKTFMFDPVTQTWSSVASNDDGHKIHATADFNHVTGQTFLFGGVISLPNRITSYDPVLSQWQDVTTTGVTPVNADGAQIALDTANDVMVYVSVLEDQYSYTNVSGDSQTMVLYLNSLKWTVPDVDFTPPNFGLGFAMAYLEKYDVSVYLTRDGTRNPRMWAFRFDPEMADADNDGVLDADDNCPWVTNPEQENTNGSDRGDACYMYPTGC